MLLSKSLRQMPTVQIPVAEYRESEHQWQRQVRASNKRFKIVCWHRRARKTTMALNILIEACCETKNKTFGYIAPTYTQAKSIAVVDPMMLKRYIPGLVKAKPFNESDLRQEFKGGSVLEIKGADNPDSIRGVGWQGVVLEEWATMKHGRQIWEEILEPILRENGGWAVFIYTPKGKNFAYEYSERAKQDKTGDWMFSLLRASQSGLIDANELLKARDSMPERLFAQEFECSFLEDASSVFHNVEGCICGDIEQPISGHRYVMGVDLGRTNDFSVLTVIDIGTNKIVAWQKFGDCAWNLQKERIVLLAKKYNNAHIEIDATGFSAGSVIAEDLMTHPIVEDLKMCQLSVSPFKFSNQSKRALVEKLIVAIEQRLITYPNIEDLISELKFFTYEVSEFGNVRYTAPEGLHDDCVMSLGLAVWALGSYIYAPINNGRIHKKQSRPKMNSGMN